MNAIKNNLETFKQELKVALELATSPTQLEEVRIAFLGRNGRIATIMSVIKDLSAEDKRTFGPELNACKVWAELAFQEKKETLIKQEILRDTMRKQLFDVTSYKPQTLTGKLHIYTQIIQELEDIFISMGYDIVDGPEVETDYYNFQALNIPADHPARDMQDTFWLDTPGMLLRTQTSPAQIHAMEKRELPLAIFSPGRVYRCEATDASHDFMFTQAEGLFIDKKVSIANLMATAQQFLQKFFDRKDLAIRVRPGYFPFVEPGLEIDGSCPFCVAGCSICKKTGWIELLGAGLVHPNVLRYCGIDPEKYSGFAFGTGLERLAMIKHGINDIRLFHSSKIDFLDQF